MVEIPLESRRQMAAQQQRLEIPAMYDSLTWYERRLVREQYAILQGGLCYYCKSSLELDVVEHIRAQFPLDPRLWPPAFFEHPVHLHHDHNTGFTLGATHAYCNAVLAQYHGE